MWSAALPLDSASVRVTDLALRRLPYVLDLNHDGKAKLVAPHEQPKRLTISVVDADTGRSRWKRTISPSSQSHWQRFLQYPDINCDGHDELAVVSACFLESDRYRSGYDPTWPRIFVDVLSGKDGRPISWWRGPNFDSNQRRIESIELGPLGSDGRPDLMITTVFRHYVQPGSLRAVYLVSAARGVETHRLDAVHATRLADFNGDGLPDLFTARDTREGMQLKVLAGAAPEAWRRLGDVRPAQDYNGDGLTDAVEVAGESKPSLRIISGRDGQVLSQPAIEWRDQRIAEKPVVTAPPLPNGDLDGDGVTDLLVASEWRVPFRMESQAFALMAISGATGRRVWDSPNWTMGPSLREQAAFAVSVVDLKPFCADLDRDGSPEIVCPHRVFWHGAGPSSGLISQVCLTVIGGRDGRVVWTEALGKPVELGAVLYEFQLPYVVSPDLHDVNGDGTADLVVTVPDYRTPGSIQDISCDVWAVSGRDGSRLWQQPLKRVVPPHSIQHNQLAAAAVGDLDADGNAEIAIADVDTANAASELIFRLLVILETPGEFDDLHARGRAGRPGRRRAQVGRRAILRSVARREQGHAGVLRFGRPRTAANHRGAGMGILQPARDRGTSRRSDIGGQSRPRPDDRPIGQGIRQHRQAALGDTRERLDADRGHRSRQILTHAGHRQGPHVLWRRGFDR